MTGVSVTATSGQETVQGTTGSNGVAKLALTQSFIRVPNTLTGAQQVTSYTPHTVSVQLAGYSTVTQAITMDASKALDVTLRTSGAGDTTPPGRITDLRAL